MIIKEINSRNSQTDMEDYRGLYKTMAEIWALTEMFKYLNCLNASVIKLNACGQNWTFWVRYIWQGYLSHLGKNMKFGKFRSFGEKVCKRTFW